jgi:type III secretion protein V
LTVPSGPVYAASMTGERSAGIARHADLVLAALVVAIVAMMIVPLPTPLLDLLISLNIAVAVTLLLVSLYVADALKIATFPTLLLLTTLYRLALEVSATRLILLRADAGSVIRAFGGFVVAGNLVVGAVIFLILTVIQFIVISKGAERIAEVAARFTLDAMPGKQMAIDGELRAGHIDAAEARRRRAALARESQLFGSMDGAMKFVKGDALAGIVVLAVNIVGGLVIGVLQRGMAWGAAARTYTVLTIGEGLVAQIPALVISTAAGIIVTRVASEDEGGHLGREIGREVLAHPRALAVAAALLSLLAVVPGLPAAPFLALGAALGAVAWRLLRAPSGAGAAAASGPRASLTPLRAPVAVEVSAGLAEAMGPPGAAGRFGGEIAPRVGARLYAELGLPPPPVELRAGAPGLAGGAYALLVNEVPVARGEVPAASAGEAPALIGDHLLRVLRRHARELLGIEETQALLDALARTHPALVREVVPKLVSPVLLADVARRLLDEGVSLRHLADVLGALAEHAPRERDPAALAEHARAALRRAITHQHARDGALPAFVLDPMIEDTIREAVTRTATGSALALEPALSRDIAGAIGRAVERDRAAVVLTIAEIRRHVRRLVETDHPDLAVLSYQELTPETRIRTVARIEI